MSKTKALTEIETTTDSETDARTAVLRFNSCLGRALEHLGKPNSNWPKVLASSLTNIRQSLTGCHLVQMKNEDTGEIYYVTAGSQLIPLKVLLTKEEPETDA